MIRITIIILFLAGLSSCSTYRLKREQAHHMESALSILSSTPVVDTHIDFPWSLVERKEWFQPGYTGLALRHPGGEFDYDRAVKGGLYGAFMSIYIPAHYQKKPGSARAVADSLITTIDQIIKAHPANFTYGLTPVDVTTAFKSGKVALPMGMENGAPIERLEDVAYFFDRGIRYVTLTHSRDNQICDSSYDTLNTNGGLSAFGRQVVQEMNRVGIMVDVSHLSDQSIVDVLKVAQKPLLASHSACRHFTPGFIRNLPDSLIQAIAKTGGVIQVPFSHFFLSDTSRLEYNAAEAALKEKGLPGQSPEAKYFMRKELKKASTSASTVADQIDYIRRLVGIDYVGIGSDFDGVGLALPPDLADVSMYPNLLVELLKRGYSEADIKKICSENLLRVWKANE